MVVEAAQLYFEIVNPKFISSKVRYAYVLYRY